MSFEHIIKPLEAMEEYKLLLSSIQSGARIVEAHGISDTQKALIAAALCKKFNKSCVLLTYNDITARKIYEDIAFFDSGMGQLLPAKELIFHRVDARSNDTRQKRLEVIGELLGGTL